MPRLRLTHDRRIKSITFADLDAIVALDASATRSEALGNASTTSSLAFPPEVRRSGSWSLGRRLL